MNIDNFDLAPCVRLLNDVHFTSHGIDSAINLKRGQIIRSGDETFGPDVVAQWLEAGEVEEVRLGIGFELDDGSEKPVWVSVSEITRLVNLPAPVAVGAES